MSFYFRPDNVPELDGLSRWEQRVLLRGTFLKERAMSTLVLLVLVIASVQFMINPLLAAFWPGFQNNSVAYAGVLVGWLILLMWLRDVVMMNILRPKIAIKRAEKKNAPTTESA
jgi:fatty acid desaturase